MSSTFRLATLNVHSWYDAKGRDNFDRVKAIVKRHNVDVLCLQETHRRDDAKFAKEMDFGFVASSHMCAILSKFPMKQGAENKHAQHRRYVQGEISLPGVQKPLHVTCLHLDHREEPRRLADLDRVLDATAALLKAKAKQVWTGDFNALTREDYSDEYWADVTLVRERNCWESPKTQLTTKVKSYGLQDCWELAGRPGPVTTCRFNTRIDYVYVSPQVLDDHRLVGVTHVDDDASDHNMVVAEFQLNNATPSL